MQPDQDARDRYHFAKLALFNVRLLGRLQSAGDGSIVKNIIEDVARNNGMMETPSLLHQATFLQFSYICLVWLWESAKGAKLETNLLAEFPSVATRLSLNLPEATQVAGEREVKDWPAVIRLLRNALGHGRVKAIDNLFEFSDQNTYGRNPESAATTITISWEHLAKISEAVIHSLTPVLWPNQPNPALKRDCAKARSPLA
ncbi:hypothetical protein GALL_357330 [mine drainage metagenome]|uniref:pEK499-p136 HEPN domain-containing protein n=1 Tax=mine drainage metagenome TaxID=410659 RepID=A0A1J5R2U2_9ZZZZ